ncbi:tRNA (adenosine(37)-N6)-threonylcarbamoyltransferase complex ATPase subunit type 1 TsaE [Bacillaceae bacterium W0354]
MFTIFTKNEDETKKLGRTIAKKLAPGDVVTLDGDLGAGKTTFTKGLAEGLGVKRTVNSPTFTIIKEYAGENFPLYHMDVYRLEHSEEDIGFEEYFYSDGVTVVEWSTFIEEFLPEQLLKINIEREGEHHRKITLTPTSPKLKNICEELIHDHFRN